MALYTKKEFLVLCEIEPKHLTTYIGRGKVVMSGEHIDESLPVNANFIANRLLYLEQKKKESTEPKVEEIVKPDPVVNKKVETPKPKQISTSNIAVTEPKRIRNAQPNTSSINRFDLDNQIKLVELDKKTVETQLLRIKEEKLLGTVIPTESVKVLVTQFSKSIMSEFKNGTENILTKITAQANLNRNQVAELRAEFVEVINAAINASVDDAKKGLQNLVTEISLKKEVGERN